MTEGFNIKTDDAAVAALARRVAELTKAVDSHNCHNLAYTVMVRAFLEQLRLRYRIDTTAAECMAQSALENLPTSDAPGSMLTPGAVNKAKQIVAEMFKPMQAPQVAKRDKFAVIGGGKDGELS